MTKPFPKPRNIRDAVLWTVAWFDVFGQPLTLREVHRWLWGMRADLSRVELALLEHRGISSEEHGGERFFFLTGRANIINLRLRRERIARDFWHKVNKYNWVFRISPHVEMVAIANTLAMGFPESDSDIDLFVITRKNHMWGARFCLTAMLHLLGVRRHGEKVAKRFCLSFFTTEEAFDFRQIAKKPLDPYLAQWILTLTPVFEEDHTIAKFWGANLWARDYFPNFTPGSLGKVPKRGFFTKTITFLRELVINKYTEKLLRHWLLPRANKKAQKLNKEADVVISDDMLKFHGKDMRNQFIRKWRQNIRDIDPAADIK